jgi:hypothetical protein
MDFGPAFSFRRSAWYRFTTFGVISEEEGREQQRKTIQQAADEFLGDYRAKHQSATYAEYALRHVSSLSP